MYGIETDGIRYRDRTGRKAFTRTEVNKLADVFDAAGVEVAIFEILGSN